MELQDLGEVTGGIGQKRVEGSRGESVECSVRGSKDGEGTFARKGIDEVRLGDGRDESGKVRVRRCDVNDGSERQR